MSDYAYIKELETKSSDGKSTVVTPIGHHSISTWSSSGNSTTHAFEIVLDNSTSTSSGLLSISCTTSFNKFALIVIPLNKAFPVSTYKVIHDDDLLVSVKYFSPSNNPSRATYSVECNTNFLCNVSLHQPVSCNITAVSNSKAAKATNEIARYKQHLVLTPDDYGKELPTTELTTGRVFFLEV